MSSNQATQSLNNSYNELVSEKQKIDQALNDYDGINQKYEDSMIYAEQNRSQYMLWFAFTLFIGSYLFKVIMFPNNQINIFRMLFWFFLIILFLLSGLNMDKTPGFLLWGIIIVLVVIINMKLIPGP